MENQKIDYLKEDPTIANQTIALVSMVEPTNSRLLMNRESFFATRFLKGFIEEYTQALEYKFKEGEDKLTDVIKEKLDISYENVKKQYYEFQKLSLEKLEEEFTKNHNKNQEPTVTGFKVRGVFPNQMVAASKAKELNVYEPFSDIFAIEVGKWTPYCPMNTDSITPEYANEKLNKLVKNKIDESDKAKIAYEENKIKQMEKIAKENEEKKKLNTITEEKEEPEVEEIKDEDLLELLEEEEKKEKKVKKNKKKVKKVKKVKKGKGRKSRN